METPSPYDFIIAGAGCAGLSLLMHLIQSGQFSDRRILLADKEQKHQNDRTWCYWEKEEGLFEPVVCKTWDQLEVNADGYSGIYEISPYRYKMIRADDFYQYCFREIGKHKHVSVKYGHISSVASREGHAEMVLNGEVFKAKYIFNSILPEIPPLTANQYWLWQHFRGWIIEATESPFNPARATLMDFRVSGEYGCAFVYVMPMSESRALVEYTVFSKELIGDKQYEEEIKKYLAEVLGIRHYTILEDEAGKIPMTNFPFKSSSGHVINIGTAGGQTKASSGYTFRNIQKHAAAIVGELTVKGHPYTNRHSRRFDFYDSVLLNILFHGTVTGTKIFTDLFRKNKPQLVLKFLDNETSFFQELKIISSLPLLPFLKAARQQIR